MLLPKWQFSEGQISLMTLPKILTMQIEFDMDCKYDALRIYDGSTDDEESLVAQLCYGKGVKLMP